MRLVPRVFHGGFCPNEFFIVFSSHISGYFTKRNANVFLCMTIRVGLLIGLPVTLFVGHFRQNI